MTADYRGASVGAGVAELGIDTASEEISVILCGFFVSFTVFNIEFSLLIVLHTHVVIVSNR